MNSHQSPSLQPPSLSVSQSLNLPLLSALFTAFSLAFSADWWQHAIHANPHIWTAVFLAFNLFCLTKWDAATRGHGDAGTRGRGDTAIFSPYRPIAASWFRGRKGMAMSGILLFVVVCVGGLVTVSAAAAAIYFILKERRNQ